ncbi:melanocortin receptor 5-like [Saccostrea cucullata]|uniref:melanocortin receptor 5-like n=1 Tax=Saccostrea cuccullata TaxID=36930 RepID=UPI002ECFEE26
MVAFITADTTTLIDSLSLMNELNSTNQPDNHTMFQTEDDINSSSLSKDILALATTEHYEESDSTTNDAPEVTESLTSATTESCSTSGDNLKLTTSNEMAKINSSDFMSSNESQTPFQKLSNNSSSFRFEIPMTISLLSVFVGIVVITFNFVVIVASIKNRELRQNTNYNLVMGLSLSDFLMGVCALLAGLRFIFSKFTQVLELCILANMLALIGMNMSLFQTLCISIHRFLVLSENAWAKHLFDNNRKYYICISGWVATFTIYTSLISPEDDHTNCYYVTVYGPNMKAVQQMTSAFISTFMFLIAVFYSLAIYQVRKRYIGTSRVTSTGQMEDRKKKRIMKATKLVGMIILALVVFSGPMLICFMLPFTPHPIVVGSFAAANINSLLNPIIYSSRITQLRKELKSIFCCKE